MPKAKFTDEEKKQIIRNIDAYFIGVLPDALEGSGYFYKSDAIDFLYGTNIPGQIPRDRELMKHFNELSADEREKYIRLALKSYPCKIVA